MRNAIGDQLVDVVIAVRWAVLDESRNAVASAEASGIVAQPDGGAGSEVYVERRFREAPGSLPVDETSPDASSLLSAEQLDATPCSVSVRLTSAESETSFVRGALDLPAEFSIDPALANDRSPGTYGLDYISLPGAVRIRIE